MWKCELWAVFTLQWTVISIMKWTVIMQWTVISMKLIYYVVDCYFMLWKCGQLFYDCGLLIYAGSVVITMQFIMQWTLTMFFYCCLLVFTMWTYFKMWIVYLFFILAKFSPIGSIYGKNYLIE